MSYWVVYAGYGMNNSYNDVTAKVQALYAGGQTSFTCANANVDRSDPDPGVIKTLWIVYAGAPTGITAFYSASTTDNSVSPATLPS